MASSNKGADGKNYPLTPKQERFAQEVVKGANQSDAYRAAYNCKNMTSKTIWQRASELHADRKVAARIEELRAPALVSIQMTLDSHLQDLLELRNLAKESKQHAAAIAAEIARGKAAGIHIERTIQDQNINARGVSTSTSALLESLRSGGRDPGVEGTVSH